MQIRSKQSPKPIQPDREGRLGPTRRPAGRRPVMYQSWRELLFLHWAIEPEQIQRTLPPGLHVDTHEGRAYLGVVPFHMQGVRPRFCPPVPGLSRFPELNLRTYVHDDFGRPGVWFYSLDAHQWLAVQIARRFFSLPYVYSRMRVHPEQDSDSRRVTITCRRAGQEEQVYTYAQRAVLKQSEPDSLTFFLTERYLLFSYHAKRRRLYVGQVHHTPYPLHEAAVERFSTDLFPLNGFERPESAPDHVAMSPGVKVTIFGLQEVTQPINTGTRS
jgi:uncharacterized protein YqjF (DUF2071 family)